ncbi:hypothetical protein RB200_24140 [Streptomyces sp. PmtG]
MTAAPPPLALDGAVLSVAKSAAEPSEDAAALDLARGRVAVSDGATRAFASGTWARCLVRRFVTRPPDALDARALGRWTAEAAADWSHGVRLPPDAPPYLYDAVERGSHATLLGLVAEPGRDGAGGVRWRAVAVGDTCLMTLTGDALRGSFPLDRPDQFTSAPALLPTAPGALPQAVAAARVASGACGAGDVLLVMTDALARWSLERAARGPRVWRFLRGAAPEEFASEVRALWRRGELEEDDITLVRCRVGGAAPDLPAR